MIYSFQCDVGVGSNLMNRLLYTSPVKHMVIGAGCSIVSEATAQASHHWNLVQVGIRWSQAVKVGQQPVHIQGGGRYCGSGMHIFCRKLEQNYLFEI